MLFLLSYLLAIPALSTVRGSISGVVLNDESTIIFQCFWTNVDLKSIEQLNGTAGLPILFDLRVKRIRRGVLGIAGSATINDEFSKYTVRYVVPNILHYSCAAYISSIQAEMDVYYRRSESTAYSKLPIRMINGPLCDKINNEYRKYLMTEEVEAAYFQEAVGDNYCVSLKRGTVYTVDNMELPKRLPMFLEKGLYRCELVVRDSNGTITSGMTTNMILS